MIVKPDAKKLLELSTIELFSKNPVDAVTVKDIVKNCHLSTRTFYNYFKDKYQIINSCYFSIMENYFDENKDRLNFHLWLLYTTEIVWENRSFFINIFKYTGQNNVRISVVTPLKELYLRLIEEVYHDEITPAIDDSLTFFLMGCLAHVEDAFLKNDIPDPQTTVAYFENAIPKHLSKYL